MKEVVEVNKHKAPQPQKISSSHEVQHRAHEAKIDYVVEHREEFLKLVAAAGEQSIQEVVDELGYVSSMFGVTFDEHLFKRWLHAYSPHSVDWNFNARPINFAVYQSVMAIQSRGKVVAA
jgi:hypothetical protein